MSQVDHRSNAQQLAVQFCHDLNNLCQHPQPHFFCPFTMHVDSQEPSRAHPRSKHRETTQDLAGKIFAIQRKNNSPYILISSTFIRSSHQLSSSIRTKERTPDQGSSPLAPKAIPVDASMLSASPRRHHPPAVGVSRPDAELDEFSRRLNISRSPRRHHASPTKILGPSSGNRLFNPDIDPIPTRLTVEPETISESDSYAPRGSQSQRQLFNPRKDDPVRFSVLTRPSGTHDNRPPPQSQSSADYVSASSTSSYAQSNFTLSSTTDGSSAGSALFEKKEAPDTFSGQLKRIYRTITALEVKISNGDAADEAREEIGRLTLKGKDKEDEEADPEQQRWLRIIHDHKKCV